MNILQARFFATSHSETNPMETLDRRTLVFGTASLIIASAVPASAETKPSVRVAKTATCGCCSAWVDHMRANGFKVEAENMAMGQLSRVKADAGIKPELASCHTAHVAGYTIEGHVPAADVEKLLRQKPDAIGLTVPGMPIGSPGMEVGTERDAYDVLLIKRDGSTKVFTRYEAKS